MRRRRNSKLRDVGSKYGAPMGRGSDTVSGNVTLEQVRLDEGGYDSGGAYWGSGAGTQPLWVAEDEDGNQEFFRARDRKAALAELDRDDVTIVRSAERAHADEDSKLDTDGTLAQLLEQAAESGELPSEHWRDLEVTDELRKTAKEYEAALWGVLSELVAAHPPEGDADANDLMDEGDAPYNVLMTLTGSGVGIDDGRWEQFYDDDVMERKVRPFVEARLGKWANDTGSGKLLEALSDAVYEAEQRLGIERDEDGEVIEREENRRRVRRSRRPNAPMVRFGVFMPGERHSSSTVYFSEDMSEGEVKRSLIEDEGYDSRITVKRMDRRRTGVPPEHYLTSRPGARVENSRPAKVGQRVTVNMGRRGGVQSGTVTRLLPDARFEWTNAHNFRRVSKLSQITHAPERAGQADPYVDEWLNEEGNEE